MPVMNQRPPFPPVACVRCGNDGPEEMLILSHYRGGFYVDGEYWGICKNCRKSFRRWMKRRRNAAHS